MKKPEHDAPLQKWIGYRARRARMKQGWSQKYLTEMASLPPGFVSRIETGEFTQLEPDKLCKLAMTLKTTTDYLLLGEKEEAPTEN